MLRGLTPAEAVVRSARSRTACGALVVLAALLGFALLPTRAGAVGSVAPAARGLEDGRLFVDPAVRETVDERTRRRLTRLLDGRDEPIFVALVAFAPADRFDGDGPRFLAALAGRLQRPGIYVTYDARGILWTRGYRVARSLSGRVDQAARIANLEGGYRSPPGPRLTSFLGILDEPDLAARERRASAAFNDRVGSAQQPSTTDSEEDGGGVSGALLVAIAATVLALLAGTFVLARRRRGARPVDDRPVLPGRVFELAREASRDDLAERADSMLIALSDLIDAAPPSADTARALDGYEAAGRVLRSGERDVPDLVGALVCIDVGRHALSEAIDPPPCTYDPRHGAAEGPAVTVDHAKLRLCPACRRDVAAGRPADVLRDGAGRPYLESDSPWAATGYGAWGDPVRAVLDRRQSSR